MLGSGGHAGEKDAVPPVSTRGALRAGAAEPPGRGYFPDRPTGTTSARMLGTRDLENRPSYGCGGSHRSPVSFLHGLGSHECGAGLPFPGSPGPGQHNPLGAAVLNNPRAGWGWGPIPQVLWEWHPLGLCTSAALVSQAHRPSGLIREPGTQTLLTSGNVQVRSGSAQVPVSTLPSFSSPSTLLPSCPHPPL